MRRSGRGLEAMPLQNRVTLMGDIVVAPERGLFTENRGGRITLWFARDPPYLSLHVKNTNEPL